MYHETGHVVVHKAISHVQLTDFVIGYDVDASAIRACPNASIIVLKQNLNVIEAKSLSSGQVSPGFSVVNGNTTECGNPDVSTFCLNNVVYFVVGKSI